MTWICPRCNCKINVSDKTEAAICQNCHAFIKKAGANPVPTELSPTLIKQGEGWTPIFHERNKKTLEKA